MSKIKYTKFSGVGKTRNTTLSKQGEDVIAESLEDLHNSVKDCAWSPVVFKDGIRNKENFSSASVLGLDFDGTVTVDVVKNRLRDFGLKYSISYSHNHTSSAHRFRVIIPLERMTKSLKKYEDTLRTALEMFPEADTQCSDGSRFFFNSKELDEINDSGDDFKIFEKKDVSKKAPANIEKIEGAAIIGTAALNFMKNAASGIPGSWNTTLNKASYDMGLGGVPRELAIQLLEAFSPNAFDVKDTKTFNSGYKAGERDFDKCGSNLVLAKLGAKGKKPSAESVYNMLEDTIRDKYFVIEDEQGRKAQILKDVGNKKVQRSSKDAVADVAVKVTKKEFGHFMPAKEADTHVENWMCHSIPLLEEPCSVAFAEEDIYAYHKLDFSPKIGKTPVFNEFLSRCSNAEALCAFIWGLFVSKSDRQQYIWIYGDGMNGKSSIGDFLSRCLGPAYMSKNSVNAYNNKNFTSTLVSKRLAVFSDNNAVGFVQSGTFKELTGGDKIEVEFKYEASYSAKLDIKFMFFSNHLPRLSSKKADMRRIILCEAAPIIGDPDPHYIDKLWEEREGILHKCKEVYNRIVKDNGVIPCDIVQAENAAGDSEVGFESIFNEYLEEDKEGMVAGVELYDTIRGALKSHGVKLAHFKDWLTRTKKVAIVNKMRKQYYKGINIL